MRYPARASRLILWVVMLCVTCSPALRAAAQADTELRDAIRTLASPKFDEREEATRTLMAREDVSRSDLARYYAEATYPEVRHRLRRVAEHHTIRQAWMTQVQPGGPGSLGVVLSVFTSPIAVPDDQIDRVENASFLPGMQFVGPNQNAEANRLVVYGTRVERTLSGFPAHAHLQIGDVLVGVDKDFVPATRDINPQVANTLLVRAIKSHEHGQPARLTVVRNGKWVSVTVKLASQEGLEYVYAQAAIGPRRIAPDIPWDEIRDAMFPDQPANSQ